RAGDLASAHDVAEGGLLTALAEAALAGGIGATVELEPLDGTDARTTLFGEGPGGFVLTGSDDALAARAERSAGGPLAVTGPGGGDALDVRCGDEHAQEQLDAMAVAHAARGRLFD